MHVHFVHSTQCLTPLSLLVAFHMVIENLLGLTVNINLIKLACIAFANLIYSTHQRRTFLPFYVVFVLLLCTTSLLFFSAVFRLLYTYVCLWFPVLSSLFAQYS